MASNSCINKMLAFNTVGYDKHVSQLNPESVELPTQSEFYPGVSELASQPLPSDEQATKIQSAFRGMLTRKHNADLTNPEKRALALRKYYDPLKYSQPVHTLRRMHISHREVGNELDKKKLMSLVGQRDKFLNSNTAGLVVMARRDPFTDSEIMQQARRSRLEQQADRLRNSEVQHGLKLDQLNWDVEESKLSPRVAGNRKHRQSRGVALGQGRGRASLSNTDLGYSDEIEFNIEGTGYSDSSMMQESLKNESIIDDLAQSKAMSRSRSRGGVQHSRKHATQSSRDDSSIAEESLGFGFLRGQGGGQNDKVSRKTSLIDAEVSDSNPFGFLHKKPDLAPPSQPKRRSEEFDQEDQGFLRMSNPSLKPFSRDPKVAQYSSTGLQPGAQIRPAALDSSTYAPVVPSDPYSPPKQEIYKANNSTSKAIQGQLATMLKEVRHNSGLLKEMQQAGGPTIKKMPGVDQEIGLRAEENERLLKKLLNKVALAREEINRPEQLEAAMMRLPLQNPHRLENLNPASILDHQSRVGITDHCYDQFTFDQLFARAALSTQNLAVLDDQRYELTVRQLEDRIRRLDEAEADLEGAVDRHRKAIEGSSQVAMERFDAAVEARRASINRLLRKQPAFSDQGTDQKRREGHTVEILRTNAQHQTSLKHFDVISEEDQRSVTQVSDYQESLEPLGSISWLEASELKQKKFTNFN